MARLLRIEYPGAYYHVTARGTERKAIFRDVLDRKKFFVILSSSIEQFVVRILSSSIEQFVVRLHAYVLMLAGVRSCKTTHPLIACRKSVSRSVFI